MFKHNTWKNQPQLSNSRLVYTRGIRQNLSVAELNWELPPTSIRCETFRHEIIKHNGCDNHIYSAPFSRRSPDSQGCRNIRDVSHNRILKRNTLFCGTLISTLLALPQIMHCWRYSFIFPEPLLYVAFPINGVNSLQGQYKPHFIAMTLKTRTSSLLFADDVFLLSLSCTDLQLSLEFVHHVSVLKESTSSCISGVRLKQSGRMKSRFGQQWWGRKIGLSWWRGSWAGWFTLLVALHFNCHLWSWASGHDQTN